MKSAFKADLNNILDRFEGLSFTEQVSGLESNSFFSLANIREEDTTRMRCPSVNQSAISKHDGTSTNKRNRKESNANSVRSSLSKNKSSSILVSEDTREYVTTIPFTLKTNHNVNTQPVPPNELFANTQTLTMDRVSREENANRDRSSPGIHPIE
jgi:predicted choloylglycine hydrolase